MRSAAIIGAALLLAVPAPALADDPVPVPVAAPEWVSAERSGTSANVSWPASPGATGYLVTAQPGGQQCATALTTCVFDGLPTGSSYTFTVTASDATSTSAPSPASTPLRIPARLSAPIFDKSKVLVGRSRMGRKIWAVRQGNPLAVDVLLSVGQMHGSEPAGLRVTDRIRRTSVPSDAEYQLWTIRTMNPDGARRGDRYNRRGVDLNRNFPGTWSAGQLRSGRRAASEPETRAMMRFIKRLRPTGVLSFHQPWNTTLSVCDLRSQYWVRRAAQLMKLRDPGRARSCGRWYPGTMSRWTTGATAAWFVTVELAPNRRVGRQIPRAARSVIRIAQEMSDADHRPAGRVLG